MGRPASSSLSSSSENKVFGVRISAELVKKLRILSIETEVPVFALVEEAIQDLLKKRKPK